MPFPEKEQPSCLIYSVNTFGIQRGWMTKFHWLHLLRQGHLAAAHPRSAWPSARLFVDPAIGVVMLQIVGTVTHNFLLKRRREGKQTPASLLLSCLMCKHQAALSQERDVSLMHSSWSSFQSTNILITKLHGGWQCLAALLATSATLWLPEAPLAQTAYGASL